jgi:hypothetical protein
MTKKEVVIFLSYARDDQDAVKLVYKKLQMEGYSPWMDQYDILPGENWENCIKNAIKKATFFLIFLSNHSVNRRGVLQKEVRAALVAETGMLPTDIYLIPVRVSDCPIPDELASFQWVDLLEESGWDRLLSAIKAGLKRRESDPRYKMGVLTSSKKEETK